jgi:hypothetical protein
MQYPNFIRVGSWGFTRITNWVLWSTYSAGWYHLVEYIYLAIYPLYLFRKSTFCFEGKIYKVRTINYLLVGSLGFMRIIKWVPWSTWSTLVHVECMVISFNRVRLSCHISVFVVVLLLFCIFWHLFGNLRGLKVLFAICKLLSLFTRKYLTFNLH